MTDYSHYQHLLFTRQDHGVLLITINRPEVFNATIPASIGNCRASGSILAMIPTHASSSSLALARRFLPGVTWI